MRSVINEPEDNTQSKLCMSSPGYVVYEVIAVETQVGVTVAPEGPVTGG